MSLLSSLAKGYTTTMVIKKFLHSCLLIEDKGKRLLIDPGLFSFIEHKITPADIGPVDTILLTHSHPDHCYPDALKQFVDMRLPQIITHEEIGMLLSKEGIAYQAIQDGQTLEVVGFSVRALHAPHGELPIHVPTNFGYIINDTVFHPGDSYDFTHSPRVPVLALPTFAPWGTLSQAMQLIQRVSPRTVIPIHDGYVKDFMSERIYQMIVQPFCAERDIDFRALQLGQSVELPSA